MIDDTVVTDDDGRVDDEVDVYHRATAAEDKDDDTDDGVVDAEKVQYADGDNGYNDDEYDDDDSEGLDQSTYYATFGHDYSSELEGAYMGSDGIKLDMMRQPYHDLPEKQALNTKAVKKSMRGSHSLAGYYGGTSELFDDESSVAASIAVLGILLVIIVSGCVYVSFRHTMHSTAPYKRSNKNDLLSMTSFSKRCE